MSTADVRIIEAIDKCYGGSGPLATEACAGIKEGTVEGRSWLHRLGLS